MGHSWLLPTLLALPLVGALLLMLVPREETTFAKGVALVTSLVTFVLSLLVWKWFTPTEAGYQLVCNASWIDALGVRFKLGVDGISIWLVLLTTFLVPLVLLSAWSAIQKKVKEFLIAFLILEAGMLGAFTALDLFVFYVMWEVMLVPMYFIIGVWGGERRIYASIKFVLFTMLGSLLMLVAIFYVYVKYGQTTGVYTFDLELLYALQLPRSAQYYCFLAFALAFAIKVPLFPFHTWLPDAHVEAPTSGSVILAGVLLKFGIYGFIRLAIPLFPHASYQFAPYIVALAVIGIVYGALVAFAQQDVKKLIAYSSVSHLGFCMLGLYAMNAPGIEGSIFAMVSHGLTTSGLFLAIGVLYDRRHTRQLADFGGLWAKMPVFAACFLIVTLGSAGLPGLSGFVGEFLALLGAFSAGDAIPGAGIWTAVAASGVILGAVYLLYMFQKVMFGPITNDQNRHITDMNAREVTVFVPLLLAIFFLGIYPKPFLAAMEPAVLKFISVYQTKLADEANTVHLVSGIGPAAAAGEPTEPPTEPPTDRALRAPAEQAAPPTDGVLRGRGLPAGPSGQAGSAP